MAFVTCNANLAEVYRIMKKYEKVEEKYFKAIKTYKKNNFRDGYIFAGICNNLGLFFEETGRYKDSVKWQKKSLKILEDLENSKVQGAIIRSNMVNSYLKIDEKKLAEKSMNMALEALQNEVGKIVIYILTFYIIWQMSILKTKATKNRLSCWKNAKNCVKPLLELKVKFIKVFWKKF